MDPQQYIHSIVAHSSRLLTSSIFPGNNYVDFANWLLLKVPAPLNRSTPDQHVLAILYDLDVPPEKPQCFIAEELPSLASSLPSTRGKGQLLFIRGFLSSAWLATIGSKFEVDPEFLLRHLDFFARSDSRHFYSLPSLPSTSASMVRLCVSTIVRQDVTSELDVPEALLDNQNKHAEEISMYQRQLPNRARAGDSLVRGFSIISDRHFIIEQWISISITRNGDGWLGKYYKIIEVPYRLMV